MAKRRGLGRGLDALLGGVGSASLLDGASSSEQVGDLRQLPVDMIQRGRFQPRLQMDDEALASLAASIRERGVLQPIVVRPLAAGRFEIIAGERRWRASQQAGLAHVPVIVREVDDEDALAIALIENIQRENLNAMEEAVALKRLVDEFGLTHARVAEAVGRSRAAVSNLLRLLDLNDDVRGLVESGALDMGHARALLAISGARQSQAASEVVARGLSARDTEALVKRILSTAVSAPAGNAAADPDVQRLERDLKEHLGARVEIKARSRGRGSLVIHYTSLDELDGILKHIKPS
ncbi:MAG: ParB family chromosome partitioning protein [Gammaproteobacteria bacterium]|jgi:ParB family chromosome partitioning protein